MQMGPALGVFHKPMLSTSDLSIDWPVVGKSELSKHSDPATLWSYVMEISICSLLLELS